MADVNRAFSRPSPTASDALDCVDPGADHGMIGPSMTTLPQPMLATSRRPTGRSTGRVAEVTLDGFRAVVLVEGDRLVVRTRGGHDIADRLPGLRSLGELGVPLVLDGELVVGGGRPAVFAGPGASLPDDATGSR
jgi:ATP-dependent DNA ligase